MSDGGQRQRDWGDVQEPNEPGPRRVPWGRRWFLIVTVLCVAVAVAVFLARGKDRLQRRPPQPSGTEGGADAIPPHSRHEPPPSAADPASSAPAAPADLVAEAKRVADRLLVDLPRNPPAMLLAGRIYYAFNEVARADACWTDCLKHDPTFAEARCAVAEGAWEHGDFERAARELGAVFSANPALDQKMVFFLADSLMNLGRADEAATVLERSAKGQPLPPFGLFLLGHAYLEMNRHEQARDQFEAVLAADSRSINAHFSLATVYARLGQPEKSKQNRDQYSALRKQELRESERLRPEMRKADWADPAPVVRECCLNAGKVYAARGRPGEAERLWLRALELDVRHAETRRLLELLYREQGRWEDAARLSRGPSSTDK